MQLTAYENVTPENVKFTDPKEFKVKDSNIKYKRIPIEISYGNNIQGPLVIETPTLFSSGVSEKKNQETKKLVGYSVPVCLWGKDSQSNEKEQAFFDVIKILLLLQQVFLKMNMELLLLYHWHDHSITSRLRFLIKKERGKPKKILLLLQYSMQKLSIQRNPKRYFLYLKQKGEKMLIH